MKKQLDTTSTAIKPPTFNLSKISSDKLLFGHVVWEFKYEKNAEHRIKISKEHSLKIDEAINSLVAHAKIFVQPLQESPLNTPIKKKLIKNEK